MKVLILDKITVIQYVKSEVCNNHLYLKEDRIIKRWFRKDVVERKKGFYRINAYGNPLLQYLGSSEYSLPENIYYREDTGIFVTSEKVCITMTDGKMYVVNFEPSIDRVNTKAVKFIEDLKLKTHQKHQFATIRKNKLT